eukprot:TRINITY_DN10057_c0_g1_i1.p1 TRINITY_DN10057_c0_g1~~TRINITY_DN10057_c0_g1_i1.p1  ORF type:complete len:193 (-),score=22.35 TRINITY_DN10057_c0_g1_i1:20-598(-)
MFSQENHVINSALTYAQRSPRAHLGELFSFQLPKSFQNLREGSEFDIYPPNITSPFKERRTKNAEDLYRSIGVDMKDRAAKLAHVARNFEFFGAPVGLFFTIDRQMGPGQWAHVGMMMQSVMLLAREAGLHTVAQEAWANWPKLVGNHLGLPENEQLYCGMGLGYADDSAPINQFETDRDPIDTFVQFRSRM